MDAIPYNLVKADFLKRCTEQFSAAEQEKIHQALEFAQVQSEGKYSGSGEPAFQHSVAVAAIVAFDLNLDGESVTATLLHNLKPDELLRNTFNDSIFSLVVGLQKIIEMDTHTVSVNADSFRNLVITLAGDLRVVLIKIADQLDIMRKLENVNHEIVHKFCIETRHLYAPLAHRLGLYTINSELNSLVIKYLEPEAYNQIEAHLESTKGIRDTYIEDFIRPLKKILNANGLDFKIKGRTKSIYSIWNKTINKGITLDEVYDLFAIRIILSSPIQSEKADCWQVYSLITEKYPPNPERLRNWISIPKKSGYESLHTTVLGPGNHWIEVQIRTERMDRVAEFGLASHWKYKDGTETGKLEKWLADIRAVLENDTLSIADVLEALQTESIEEEVFVFTPAGDLKRLRKGATLLDFAYSIHSEVGDHCVSGFINGKKAGIRQKLKSGDRIQIETAKNQRPKADWLHFVVTGKARLKIRTSLNEEITREAEKGKEIIKRKLKNWKLEFNNETINMMVRRLGYKFGKDLYYDIATGKLEPLRIKAILTKPLHDIAQPESPAAPIKPLNPSFDSGDTLIIYENMSNVNYQMARCCNPVFGDKIFGFITINQGIKIHRNHCPNAKQLKERYPYRVVNAQWNQQENTSAFVVTLRIAGADELGMAHRITQIITTEFQMKMQEIKFNSASGRFHGEVKVWVKNLDHLAHLIENLKKIKGILSVSRVGER
ncbi:MAG: RelA/SpoT family protein [Bacteroidales bacterium]|nr:RelA/SpoT family protein [Bacteroidales bacterium]